MKQLKKTILTLALLIAATTQAWADYTVTWEGTKLQSINVSKGFGTNATTATMTVDGITVTANKGFLYYGGTIMHFDSAEADGIVFSAENNIKSIAITSNSSSIFIPGGSFQDGGSHTYELNPAAKSYGFGEGVFIDGVTKIVITLESPVTTVPLIPTEGKTNEWTIKDGMPAGNVTVTPEYFKQAEFTAGGAPAAVEGVLAKTGAPLVTGGTVANIGTSDVKQGKVMYYAKQKSGETIPTAPTYESAWSENVPNSNDFTEGDVYVWYYIAGAEPASVAARSDANTCSDSDIKAINASGFVAVGPEPTYDVSLNKTGLADGEAAKWKAKSETVTTEVNLGTNDLEGVKKGETVTVTYTGSRKVIGVKAEKKADTKYMKWDDSQKKLVPTKIPATATKVENANGDVTWPAGTYLVEGDVTIGGDILLSGDVELIIKDGAKLSAKHISGTNYNGSLSVYGQANMSGELNVACSYVDAIIKVTALNIHSCKVNASSSVDSRGGFYGINEINVYGGSVDAEYTGSNFGFGMNFTHLNIYGGEVKAVGKGNDNYFSYGINNSNGTTVNFYGGKLWAECTGNRAINSNVTLTKGEGFNGKIETCSDGTSWTTYSGTDTPDAKYVRVGY